MKFLLISPFTSTSGSAIRFWNIASQLRNHGYKVVYVERAPKDSPPPVFEGISYYSSPKLNNLYIDIIVSLFFNLFIFFRHLDCSVYYALKPAPNNCLPALLAKLMGKRIFLDIDDLDYGYFDEGAKRTISRFFFDFFPRFFECVTCHTENLSKYIIENLKISEKRVFFLTQGVSDPFLSFTLDKSAQRKKKSIVYMATLGITSNFQSVIPLYKNICEAHPDASITVIGDGVRRLFFENEITRLGLNKNVSFTGRVNHKDIPGIMAQSQIGLNYMEHSFTNNCRAILKLREYLAVGLHVVCNDSGDSSIFKEFVYIEKDISGIEKRLISLLSEELSVNSKGSEFIGTCFNWEIIVNEFLEKVI